MPDGGGLVLRSVSVLERYPKTLVAHTRLCSVCVGRHAGTWTMLHRDGEVPRHHSFRRDYRDGEQRK